MNIPGSCRQPQPPVFLYQKPDGTMTGYQRLNHLLLSTAILTMLLTSAVSGDTPSSRHMQFLRQGIDALEKGLSDSAVSCFIRSYSEGLPKDSLFYFWAEALMRKGVLDSALAANFIAGGSNDEALRHKARLQRYTIYRLLGWRDNAQRLRDTIQTSRYYRRISPVPDIDITVAAGYGAEYRGCDTALPWGAGEGSSFIHDEQGVFGKADFKSSWHLLKGIRTLSTGISGSASYRQYTPGELRNAADSTDITGALFATLSGRRISSTGALACNRRIDDSLFIRVSLEGGTVLNNRYLQMLWGGGALSFSTNAAFNSSRWWLFTASQFNLNNCTGLTASLYSGLYLADHASFGFTLDTAKILFANDGRQPYPVFYADASYSRMIDTSAFRVLTGALRNEIISSGKDSVVNCALVQPFSNLTVNPRLGFVFKHALPVQIGFGWRLNYYREKYQWDQLLMHAHYLIFSRADGIWYAIPEDFLLGDLTITHTDNGSLAIAPTAVGTLPIVHHERRRIDNTVSIDLSVQWYNGRFGSGSIRSSGSKTWSTLMKTAPFEIAEWTLSAGFEWNFSYTPQRSDVAL